MPKYRQDLEPGEQAPQGLHSGVQLSLEFLGAKDEAVREDHKVVAALHKLALEVVDTTKNLTPEQRKIALYSVFTGFALSEGGDLID